MYSTVLLVLLLPSLARGLNIEEEILGDQALQVVQTIHEPRTNFTGTIDKHYRSFESRGHVLAPNEGRFPKELSYETAWTRTGKRKLTIVKVIQKNTSGLHDSNQRFSSAYVPLDVEVEDIDLPKRLKYWNQRKRRELFGKHRRYYIPARSFSQRFPFAVVVRISTGCTGTLVSSRHVLTSAHCLHNGKDYTKGFRSLRVGFLLANKTLEWIYAYQVKMPLAWTQGNDSDASRFDYAIIKLARRHKRQPMPITYSQGNRFGRMTKIHFTAFEDDKPMNTIWYRSCFIMASNNDMFYHCCDAQPGSSGAGIYVYSKNRRTAEQDRLIIGVFSGNRRVSYSPWWPYVGCPPRWRGNFNAGIRFNTARFKQICYWIGIRHALGDCKLYLLSQLRSREPPRRPSSPKKNRNRKRRGRETRRRGKTKTKKSKRRKRGKKSSKTNKKANN